MIKINIYAVGNIKEKYLVEAINDYKKRLSRFAKINIVEINEIKLQEKSEKEIIKIESERIIEKIDKNDYLITLDKSGAEYDSLTLSSHLEKLFDEGKGQIAFIIGGSLGLSEKIKEISNESISFSKLTFPHQLIRVNLLEILYRSFKIMRNEPYHH